MEPPPPRHRPRHPPQSTSTPRTTASMKPPQQQATTAPITAGERTTREHGRSSDICRGVRSPHGEHGRIDTLLPPPSPRSSPAPMPPILWRRCAAPSPLLHHPVPNASLSDLLPSSTPPPSLAAPHPPPLLPPLRPCGGGSG